MSGQMASAGRCQLPTERSVVLLTILLIVLVLFLLLGGGFGYGRRGRRGVYSHRAFAQSYNPFLEGICTGARLLLGS
jgi:hypothetical protein